jgi:hypothetical protein
MSTNKNEDFIRKRMMDIITEYAQLKEMDKYNLTLEAIDNHGDVKVSFERKGNHFVKTIKSTDDLSFINDTFFKDNYISISSPTIDQSSVKSASFDMFGNLILTHNDDSAESLRLKYKDKEGERERLLKKLRNNLGNKLKE